MSKDGCLGWARLGWTEACLLGEVGIVMAFAVSVWIALYCIRRIYAASGVVA